MDAELKKATMEWEEVRSSLVKLQSDVGFQHVLEYCEEVKNVHLSALKSATDHVEMLKAQANYNAYSELLEKFKIEEF